MAHKHMIPLHLQSQRNWEEDFENESGIYVNNCNNCDLEFVGLKYRRVCKDCATKHKIPNFDFKQFKEYVTTYNPDAHGGGSPDTIFLDMIYGMGLAIDDAFRFHNGFNNFKEALYERFKYEMEKKGGNNLDA